MWRQKDWQFKARWATWEDAGEQRDDSAVRVLAFLPENLNLVPGPHISPPPVTPGPGICHHHLAFHSLVPAHIAERTQKRKHIYISKKKANSF